MIIDLSQEEALKLLGEQKTARLGCILGSGEPYVVPVNYFFKDDSFYVHSLFGLKIEALRDNPKACLQVDDIRDIYSWRSVVAFGEFEEISTEPERAAILKELFAHFEKLTPVEAMRQTGEISDETILFRIRLRHLTGRKEG